MFDILFSLKIQLLVKYELQST